MFEKLRERSLSNKTKTLEKNGNIFDGFGIAEPFTLLVDSQFNLFISELSNDRNGLLSETEKKAFDSLWQVACPDFDGYGNNIWNLKEGVFSVYKDGDVKVCFEKKKSKVNDLYGCNVGRANFVYISKEGNFVINQSDRNQKAFLVYVSENISERLLKALRVAEATALKIELGDFLLDKKSGIPDEISVSSITTEIEETQSDIEKQESNDFSEKGSRRV